MASWIYVTVGVLVALIVLGVFAINTALEQSKQSEWIISSKMQESRKTWVEIEVVCVGISQRCFYPNSTLLGTHFTGDPIKTVEFIKNDYKNKGIVVFDVKYKPTLLSSCEFGECPDRYALYLLVSETDVDKMLELSFKRSPIT